LENRFERLQGLRQDYLRRKELEAMGLALHPEKTQVVRSHQGLVFLGHHLIDPPLEGGQ
jgi:hypothetical protein